MISGLDLESVGHISFCIEIFMCKICNKVKMGVLS